MAHVNMSMNMKQGLDLRHHNIEFIDQIFMTPSCLFQVIFGSENGSCVEQHSESMVGKSFVPDLLL